MAKKKNRKVFWLALISSIFLFISGTNGVAGLRSIGNVVLNYIDFQLLQPLFIILLIIASFGGLSVLVGGILALKNKELLSKIFIWLGSGAGILGFFFNLFISIITLNLPKYSSLSFSSLGIIFALAAQFVISRKSK